MNSMMNFLGIFAVVAGVAFLTWLTLQPEWRRLRNPRTLEFWRFAARCEEGAKGTEATGRASEIRCALCTYAPECAKRLADGYDVPVDNCPNAPRLHA